MSQKNAKKFRQELRREMTGAIPTIDNFVDFINRLSLKARFGIAIKILRRQFEPIRS
jgi:hypothetical protein